MLTGQRFAWQARRSWNFFFQIPNNFDNGIGGCFLGHASHVNFDIIFYTCLARGGLTAPGKYLANTNLSHNTKSRLRAPSSDYSIFNLSLIKRFCHQKWYRRCCTATCVKSEHHFILIYRINKSFYHRLCLCFRFQGKTEPPTGQMPVKNIEAKQEIRQVFLGLQKILDKTENQPEQDYTLITLLSAFSSGRCGRMGPANMEHSITSGVRRGWEIWGYIGNAMLSPSDIGLSITMHPG